MGFKLGGVEMNRQGNDLQFGQELSALSTAIIGAAFDCLRFCGAGRVSLHFDELDQGISTLDEQRRSMLIGLTLAARDLSTEAARAGVPVSPIIYLRSDLWDELQFSDKNKISQDGSFLLEWNAESLLEMVELRLKAKLGPEATWDTIAEPDLMRGSQSKWSHILARTFLRPRDVISFLNAGLAVAKKRDEGATAFKNDDISIARVAYSSYLKAELDDEIVPHWPQWTEALQACQTIGTISFQREQFDTEYQKRQSKENQVDADQALGLLYRFSVVGYRGGIGRGGSSWIFQYTDPAAGWDSVAKQLKVHQGLKEFAKLREARTSAESATSDSSDYPDESMDAVTVAELLDRLLQANKG
jgi:hypothetical protein